MNKVVDVVGERRGWLRRVGSLLYIGVSNSKAENSVFLPSSGSTCFCIKRSDHKPVCSVHVDASSTLTFEKAIGSMDACLESFASFASMREPM